MGRCYYFMMINLEMVLKQESLPGGASALDFKDSAALRFGQSDVVFCLFLVTNIKQYPLSIIGRNA